MMKGDLTVRSYDHIRVLIYFPKMKSFLEYITSRRLESDLLPLIQKTFLSNPIPTLMTIFH